MSEKEEIKQSSAQVFFNGLVKENPTFVLTLGMCPTLLLQLQQSMALAWD